MGRSPRTLLSGPTVSPPLGGSSCRARVVPDLKTSLKNTHWFRRSNTLGANRREVGAECDVVGTNRPALTAVGHRVEQGRDEWDARRDGMGEKMRSPLPLRGCRNGESLFRPARRGSAGNGRMNPGDRPIIPYGQLHDFKPDSALAEEWDVHGREALLRRSRAGPGTSPTRSSG
jgi:hypothetical protein